MCLQKIINLNDWADYEEFVEIVAVLGMVKRHLIFCNKPINYQQF